MHKPRLLTDKEVEEIREGVKSGLRGPVMSKWIEQLLADHDARAAGTGSPQGVNDHPCCVVDK